MATEPKRFRESCQRYEIRRSPVYRCTVSVTCRIEYVPCAPRRLDPLGLTRLRSSPSTGCGYALVGVVVSRLRAWNFASTSRLVERNVRVGNSRNRARPHASSRSLGRHGLAFATSRMRRRLVIELWAVRHFPPGRSPHVHNLPHHLDAPSRSLLDLISEKEETGHSRISYKHRLHRPRRP